MQSSNGGTAVGSSDPVRNGHPFVYALEFPQAANGVLIKTTRLKDTNNGSAIHLALAEAMCFRGEENVAEGALVTTNARAALRTHWHWQPRFLVDGLQPLGLPEDVSDWNKDAGWMSDSRSGADESVWVEIDLGTVRRFNRITLFPMRRLSAGHLPGFGIPSSLRIRVSTSDSDATFQTIATENFSDKPSPGHNPVKFEFDEVESRRIRILSDQLWKGFSHYPAFFALSEVQVWDGDLNISEGCAIKTSDEPKTVLAHGRRFWNSDSLTDGFTTDGRIISLREWIENWERSLDNERTQHELEVYSDLIQERRRRTTAILVSAISGVALLVAIVVPLILKRRNRQQLEEMRVRIASDLHDDLGSSLASIQMLAGVAGQQNSGDDYLRRIGRIAGETVTSVRDIVWLLNSKDSTSSSVIEHLRESAATMLEGVSWTFETDAEPTRVNLDPECRRDLTSYFREALHNVIRHAHASRVEIKYENFKEGFRLVIADDGLGIPSEKLNQASCLRALKYRAERLNATLNIDSEDSFGTRLELLVPVLLR
ncbi:MAG: histidine kinase [Verrucomicrobiota bacterium]